MILPDVTIRSNRILRFGNLMKRANSAGFFFFYPSELKMATRRRPSFCVSGLAERVDRTRLSWLVDNDVTRLFSEWMEVNLKRRRAVRPEWTRLFAYWSIMTLREASHPIRRSYWRHVVTCVHLVVPRAQTRAISVVVVHRASMMSLMLRMRRIPWMIRRWPRNWWHCRWITLTSEPHATSDLPTEPTTPITTWNDAWTRTR